MASTACIHPVILLIHQSQAQRPDDSNSNPSPLLMVICCLTTYWGIINIQYTAQTWSVQLGELWCNTDTWWTHYHNHITAPASLLPLQTIFPTLVWPPPFTGHYFSHARILCEWSHTIRALFCLAFFTRCDYFAVIHVVRIRNSFLCMDELSSIAWLSHSFLLRHNWRRTY